MLRGSIVALITPYQNFNIDIEAFEKLLYWHIQAGTQGVVVCGSTGEANLLNNEERCQLIKSAIKILKNKIPVIVGCGTPSTQQTLELINEAEKLGADAALVVAPYYVKPNQEGMFSHFSALHAGSKLPLIIYNNPGRVGVDLSVETIVRLSELPRVVALKDSNVDITRVTTLKRKLGHRLSLLSGDDPTTAAYLLYGGHGAISVTANIAPELCQKQIKAWFERDITTFEDLTHKLAPLHSALGAETNPVPIKWAVSHMLGYTTPEVRLPLTPSKQTTQEGIKLALHQLNMMKL